MLETQYRRSLIPPDRMLVSTLSGKQIYIGLEYLGSQVNPFFYAISFDSQYWRILDVRQMLAYPGDHNWLQHFALCDDSERLQAVAKLLKQSGMRIFSEYFWRPLAPPLQQADSAR